MERLTKSSCHHCLKATFRGSVHCGHCGKRLYFLPLAFTGLCVLALGFWLMNWLSPKTVLKEVQPEMRSQASWLRDHALSRQSTKSGNSIDRLMSQARSRKDLFQVVDELDLILETYPNYLYAMRLKANLLLQCHAYKRAVQAFRTYLERVPEDHNTRISLALAYLNLKQYDRAAAALESVARQYPNYPKVLKQLALVSKARGFPDLAKDYHARLEQAEKGSPSQKPPLVFHDKNPQTKSSNTREKTGRS